jgi:hypothetical protein
VVVDVDVDPLATESCSAGTRSASSTAPTTIVAVQGGRLYRFT